VRTSAGGMAAVSRGRANSLIAIDDPRFRAGRAGELRCEISGDIACEIARGDELEVLFAAATSTSADHAARACALGLRMQCVSMQCSGSACNAPHAMLGLRMQCVRLGGRLVKAPSRAPPSKRKGSGLVGMLVGFVSLGVRGVGGAESDAVMHTEQTCRAKHARGWRARSRRRSRWRSRRRSRRSSCAAS
jgi:hypothetical protein